MLHCYCSNRAKRTNFDRYMFGFKKKKKENKVLIVEDDALLAQVLSKGFEKEGFKVASVMNGTEVIEAVKKFAPQAVLLEQVWDCISLKR